MMNIRSKLDTLESQYKFFENISGNCVGILKPKIFQPVSNKNNHMICLTAEYPSYEKLFSLKDVRYHLSGYGLRREEALIRLIGEAIERYSAVYMFENYPWLVQYQSQVDLKNNQVTTTELKYLNVTSYEENAKELECSKNTTIGWVKMYDIFNNSEIMIPAQMVMLSYLNHRPITSEQIYYRAVSTGTASHTSLVAATQNALIEYLQIDSLMLFWYTDLSVPEVIIDEELYQFLATKKLIPEGAEIKIIDLTLDKPIPVFGVFIIKDTYPYFSFGIQAGTEVRNTIYRAFLECLAIFEYNVSKEIYLPDEYEVTDDTNVYMDLDTNVALWASEFRNEEKRDFLNKKIVGIKSVTDFEDVNDFFSKVRSYSLDNSFHVSCLDITPSQVFSTDWTVCRVIIPELIPMCIPDLPLKMHPRYAEFGGFKDALPHPMP